MQKKHFKRLLAKAALWVATEVLLNCTGLDNMADYSEFIFDGGLHVQRANPSIVLVAHQ
jgi:hypothetical protein